MLGMMGLTQIEKNSYEMRTNSRPNLEKCQDPIYEDASNNEKDIDPSTLVDCKAEAYLTWTM
jgi:hypothetical protein